MVRVPWLEVLSVRNGVRHVLGVGAGLVATPLIAAGFAYRAILGNEWIGVILIVGTTIVVGVLAGSRISPLASLVPGLAFAALAGAVLARVPGVLDLAFLPDDFRLGYNALAGLW